MHTIRKARLDDFNKLSDLTLKSEAYWGYDNEFLEKFNIHHNITLEFIKINYVYVLQNNDSILGYYGFQISEIINELEFLFIDPENIRNGYGKILWKHLLSFCKKKNVKEFTIISDPHAQDFYFNLGAKPYCQVDSKMTPGSKVLQLIYII